MPIFLFKQRKPEAETEGTGHRELNLLFVTERQDLFLSEISMAKLPFLLEKGSDELKPHLILKTVVPSTRLDDSGGTLRHWEDPGGLM